MTAQVIIPQEATRESNGFLKRVIPFAAIVCVVAVASCLAWLVMTTRKVSVADAEDARIQRLVVNLGNPDWGVWMAASQELIKIGKPALARLQQAVACNQEEVRNRARLIIGAIEAAGPQLAKAEPAGRPEEKEEAPPPSPAPVPVPEPAPMPEPPPMAGQPGDFPGLGGGMPGLGGMGGMPGLGGMGGMGGMPGLGGMGGIPGMGMLMGGGGMGGGQFGNLLQMSRWAQEVGIQRGLARQRGGGNPPTARRPDEEALSELSADLRNSFGARLSTARDGLRVVDVRADTPAYQSGIRVGDVVVSVNGRQVTKLEDAKKMLGEVEPGTALRLEVNRQGESMTLTVKF